MTTEARLRREAAMLSAALWAASAALVVALAAWAAELI